MSHRPAAISGRPWGVCQRCGFDFRLDQLRTEWTRLKVCSKCYDRKHPQDTIRPKEDRQVVHGASPRPADIFLEVGDVTADDF